MICLNKEYECPQCGSDIIERAWRGSKFWGCSEYQKCKLAIFDPIEETPCPQCKWLDLPPTHPTSPKATKDPVKLTPLLKTMTHPVGGHIVASLFYEALAK